MRNGRRRIYFFIHLTGRDTGNSGIQRVVRSLGSTLLARGDVDLLPVRWCQNRHAIVHAEQEWRDIIALHHGPLFSEAAENAGQPIHLDRGDAASPAWLLVPEVPHLGAHSPEYPSVSMLFVLGYARTHGFQTAAVFHDLLPITTRRLGDGDRMEQMEFIVYGQSLVNADVVMPVSRAVGETLQEWWLSHGYTQESLPPVIPAVLPEELLGTPRRQPAAMPPAGAAEFLSLGRVCDHKNQMVAIEAFNRLCAKHPGLDLRFHIVGHCDPHLQRALADAKKRSHGRVQTYGFIPDDRLAALVERSRAVVFVSLAEGYGLPIAESLWLGKPCLSSDIGSMAEIAEGGGCLVVDPTSVEAVEAGLSRFALDDAFNREKLAEIQHRKFRLWTDYAQEVLTAMRTGAARPAQPRTAARSTTPRAALPAPASAAPKAAGGIAGLLGSSGLLRGMFGGTPKAAVKRSFAIPLESMSYHDKYKQNGKPVLLQDGTLTYDSAVHGEIDEAHLFYGPYIPLGTGRYQIHFEGEMEGRLILKITRNFGTPIVETVLKSFDKPVPFELPGPVEKLEIIAGRTKALKRLVLRNIVVDVLN